MLHDVMPVPKEHLMEQMRVAYVGIDPTADSLHIGHLVGVMLLKLSGTPLACWRCDWDDWRSFGKIE
jgi:hypothetical protein